MTAGESARADWEAIRAALDDAARADLLRLARRAVEAAAFGLPAPEVAAGAVAPVLARAAAAFVTVEVGGELRGCIGSIEAQRSLADTVLAMARAASREDPRFPSIAPSDLPALTVEVSVLGPLVPAGPDDIVVGRDGIVVEQGHRRGLLLPQVAVEWGFDRETFLGQGCLKAGLVPDAWRRGARILRFEAIVFGEPAHAPGPAASPGS